MDDKHELIELDDIQQRILSIRGIQVILDRELADLYHVETRAIKQAVKRNMTRFPDDFMFELSSDEINDLVSQSVIPSKQQLGGAKPFVFTEQGVAILSSVLTSSRAIEINIQIMRAFVKMRKFVLHNANIFGRLDIIEQRQIGYRIETDQKFERIFKALEDKTKKPKQGIFFDGQVFDAYIFIAGLVKSAQKSILLIDNYVDETVLQLFTKRRTNVTVMIYTKNISRILKQDLEKHNAQHPKIEIRKFDKAHDRFLIVDESTVYHFGASLKDLGKKWFAFSKMDIEAMGMIAHLENG